MQQYKGQRLTENDLRFHLLQQMRLRRRQQYQHFMDTGTIDTGSLPTHNTTPLPVIGDTQDNDYPKTLTQKKKPGWYDRFLLMVEGLAVIALLFVVFNGFSLVQTLNREISSALQQPTLTPTPLIAPVVLPAGHTFSGGAPVPNEAEIPEHLRPIVQAMAAIPLPTQSPQQPIRIQIPAIDVDAPVVQGDGWEQLKKGVGQHIGSANPGSDGNLVLSAHNDIYGEIFRDLDQLQEGDVIRVFTSQSSYEYIVLQTQVVEPTRVDVLNQTADPITTLISCYPYGINNQRIVITAKLRK
ncbi:MAG: sortase [Anaerolineae bacterium]|nr:sortase [Anaerolineae bacterium]